MFILIKGKYRQFLENIKPGSKIFVVNYFLARFTSTQDKFNFLTNDGVITHLRSFLSGQLNSRGISVESAIQFFKKCKELLEFLYSYWPVHLFIISHFNFNPTQFNPASSVVIHIYHNINTTQHYSCARCARLLSSKKLKHSQLVQIFLLPFDVR